MPQLPRGHLVKAPSIPATPRYGLVPTIEPVTLTELHWEGSGVEWEQDLCTEVESFLDFCPPASGYTKSTEGDLEFCHADSFVVKASFECSTGGRPVAGAFEIARRRLLAWESHEVAETLWTGVTANGQVNPSFAFGNDECDIVPTDLSPGNSLDPVAAIGALEEALTDVVPGGGIIHAPYGLSPYLSHHNLIEKDGDRYYTTTGQTVILDSGYPGSGINNAVAAAGSTWIVGTGPVGLWRSNVFMTPNEVAEAVDRNVNNVTVFAERVWAAGFSCALFFVNVDLCSSCG